MGVNVLAPTQAFTAGSDLWVTGEPEQSLWAQRIDWVLNFQILRASRHEKKPVSSEVREFAEKTGLRIPGSPSTAHAPLLVPADLNLPCRWVLSPADWNLENLFSVWQQLGEPSLRVFLPKSEDSDEFTRKWSQMTDNRDFQLVVE